MHNGTQWRNRHIGQTFAFSRRLMALACRISNEMALNLTMAHHIFVIQLNQLRCGARSPHNVNPHGTSEFLHVAYNCFI